MIVKYTQLGWEVITQRGHGILAAQIGMQWKVKDRPSRWCETILAIAEHDDAEIELGKENELTGTGGPVDFTMKSFDLGHCQRLALLTITKSRYIALVTSMHMEFLYRKEAKTNGEAAKFLKEQKKERTRLRNQLNISVSECKRIYSLLEWCDALSLLICQDLMQPENRTMEISTGPDQQSYDLFKTGEHILSVDPWPFECNHFEVSVESRTIPQLTFSGADGFKKAFNRARVKETVWKISRKSAGTRKIRNIKKP